MLVYATASMLKRSIERGLAGAAYDEWLDGWVCASVQNIIGNSWPHHVLDVDDGEGARTYRDAPRVAGADITVCREEALASVAGEFDLVLALSFNRQVCFEPPDPERAYERAKLISSAANRLAPGGKLIWSYYHTFSNDDVHIHSLLEPAAIHRSLVLRGLVPISESQVEPRTLDMYHDPDTLFVHQSATHAASTQHRRITRVMGILGRSRPTEQQLSPPSTPTGIRGWLTYFSSRNRIG